MHLCNLSQKQLIKNDFIKKPSFLSTQFCNKACDFFNLKGHYLDKLMMVYIIIQNLSAKNDYHIEVYKLNSMWSVGQLIVS